ncbi:MAG: ATP-binding protein [Acidobacteriaceae bacterium]|nr:ATP-binding protein [Acidobacteriaceae bacterium]
MDAYRDSIEQISDELNRLDLLIRRALILARDLRASGNEEYRGLLISEQQIDRILESGEFLHQHWKTQEENGDKLTDLDQKLEQARKRIDRRCEMTGNKGRSLTLPHLAARFGLSQAEVDLLLIAMAPELETRYEILYAYLQDDVTRKRPSVDLALNLISRTGREKLIARRFFATGAPLIRFRLVELIDEPHDRQPTLLRRFLKLDDSVLGFLLEQPPVRLPLGNRVESQQSIQSLELDPMTRVELQNLADSLQSAGAPKSLVRVIGSDPAELQSVASALSNAHERPLIALELAALENESTDIDLLIRDATLYDAVVAVVAPPGEPSTGAEEPQRVAQARRRFWNLVEHVPRIVALGPDSVFGEAPTHLRIWKIQLKTANFEQRRQMWESALSETAHDADASRLADTFRFGGAHIRQAVAMAHSLAGIRDPSQPVSSMSDLLESGRALSGSNLRRYATVVQPRYSWSDIILPDEKRRQLEHIAIRVKHRRTVHYEWGFGEKLSRGKGLNVLFSGQSGVGKTMAAEVLASDLSLVLFQIDLSSVVSKYIGETEKHLAAIFREAEMSQSLLFFDEADALFGKRTEINDAHDRYANLEVNYLLQRIEQYEGLVILATNMQRNLDDAFLRRIQEVIDFPLPDEILRERIWRRHLPANAPVDASIDYTFLARQFKLTGGDIKNAVMTAAFLAASGSKRIGMAEMIRAVRIELQKQGKLVMKTDFGKYFEAAHQSSDLSQPLKN